MTRLDNTKKSSHAAARRVGLIGASLIAAGASLGTGCLDRPVVPATPNTSNVFVDQIRQTSIDKIDLLFVIDNSVSMADKQEILRLAVPNLVSRLVDPACVDEEGSVVSAGGGECPAGSKREFSPVNDIHIGVITSSLGSHGAGGDPPACVDVPPGNDRGRLLPTVRPDAGLGGTEPAGFLAWTSSSDAVTFLDNFQQQVVAVGETGCGYEATLEAWYRFLVDPEPPLNISRSGNTAVLDGIDEQLLQQRADFLRPDSLLAVVMLTDENDCSIMDSGSGLLAADLTWQMAEATEVCETDPNNECCISCSLIDSLPSGCNAAPCTGGGQPKLPRDQDRLNLRCFEQKRRFGLDLLYPTQRYVDGLTLPQVPNRAGELVQNPVYAPGEEGTPRDQALVFLAGIVGVPWQLIATPESEEGAGLEYLTAEQIDAQGIWPIIVGRDGEEPTDPHMMESIDPRPGLPTWADAPNSDPIHGHEFDASFQPNIYMDGAGARDDLQYACIFPLDTSRTCMAGDAACDCTPEDQGKNSPLCNGTTQTHAKGYPGTRHLEVLQDYGDNSIVASICPKNPASADASDLNAGYQPAVGAIVKRLGEVLGGRCLPRELSVDEDTGEVPCSVVEAKPTGLDCAAPGRADVSAKVAPSIRKKLEESLLCGDQTSVPCDSYQMCEIVQLVGDEGNGCRTNESFSTPGYCYVDPDRGYGNPALVANCPPTERRLLRFVGSTANPTPAPNSTTFVACVGKSFAE